MAALEVTTESLGNTLLVLYIKHTEINKDAKGKATYITFSQYCLYYGHVRFRSSKTYSNPVRPEVLGSPLTDEETEAQGVPGSQEE